MTPTTPAAARKMADEIALRISVPIANTIRSLASQVEALTAELEGYKKDAERYRWLRLNAYVDVMKFLPRIEGVQTSMFDDTIDAAIAKGTA